MHLLFLQDAQNALRGYARLDKSRVAERDVCSGIERHGLGSEFVGQDSWMLVRNGNNKAPVMTVLREHPVKQKR